jgi:hypothetical protein
LEKTFNNNVNSDEKSIINEMALSLQVYNGEYVLSYTNTLNECAYPLFSFMPRSDMSEDYFGKVWNSDNCKAGPFSSNASNFIVLCRSSL